jgi:alpha-mannosidase
VLGGSLVEAAVVRAAMNFNYPLRVGHVASSAEAAKVKEIMETIQFSGSPNIVLETIKRGEDDDDVTSTPIKKRESRNLILRIYEAYGGKGTAKVTTYSPPHIPVSHSPYSYSVPCCRFGRAWMMLMIDIWL